MIQLKAVRNIATSVFSILSCLFLLVNTTEAHEVCRITMVYKTGSKAAFIQQAPSSEGAFHDIFQLASKRIGCTFVIERYSKVLLHRLLEEGLVDFYPGASFSKEREEYLTYLPNGILTAEWGITSANFSHTLTSYQDVKKLGLSWIMEPRSSKHEIADALDIPVINMEDITLDKIATHFQQAANINHFYVADKELVDYFRTKQTLASAGLKVHTACCGGNVPMYLGVSKIVRKH